MILTVSFASCTGGCNKKPDSTIDITDISSSDTVDPSSTTAISNTTSTSQTSGTSATTKPTNTSKPTETSGTTSTTAATPTATEAPVTSDSDTTPTTTTAAPEPETTTETEAKPEPTEAPAPEPTEAPVPETTPEETKPQIQYGTCYINARYGCNGDNVYVTLYGYECSNELGYWDLTDAGYAAAEADLLALPDFFGTWDIQFGGLM